MDRARRDPRRAPRVAARYDEVLADLEWLRRRVVPEGNVHGYQAYVCLFGRRSRRLDNVARSSTSGGTRSWPRSRSAAIATRQGTHAAVRASFLELRATFGPMVR